MGRFEDAMTEGFSGQSKVRNVRMSPVGVQIGSVLLTIVLS
jgi:hypothetical protein